MTDEQQSEDYEELFNELRQETAGQRAPSGWTAVIGIGAVAVLMVSAAFALARLGPGAPISSAGDVDHTAARAPNVSFVLITEGEKELADLVDLHLAYFRWLAYHPQDSAEVRRSLTVRSPAFERVEEVMAALARVDHRVDIGELRVASLDIVEGSAAIGTITVEIEGRSDGRRVTELLSDGSIVSEVDTVEEFTARITLKQSTGPSDLNWRVSEMAGVPFFESQ
ncbi:MAG: hypothetical protein HKN93_01615 [Acidimicrobiia bacterium]|nr:hypothetical protein [Acidimicrobiia bacterium]